MSIHGIEIVNIYIIAVVAFILVYGVLTLTPIFSEKLYKRFFKKTIPTLKEVEKTTED